MLEVFKHKRDVVSSEFLIFVIGIFATFFTLWSTVPQIRKSLRTKKTDDVSRWLIISLITGLSLWVLYGVMKGDMIIVGANSIGVSLNVFLLILKLKYSD
jgi:MtN3 and saliva related transmembrane protein